VVAAAGHVRNCARDGLDLAHEFQPVPEGFDFVCPRKALQSHGADSVKCCCCKLVGSWFAQGALGKHEFEQPGFLSRDNDALTIAPFNLLDSGDLICKQVFNFCQRHRRCLMYAGVGTGAVQGCDGDEGL
jgi:hypothetical protein